jgi:acyl-CoA thioesterase-1
MARSWLFGLLLLISCAAHAAPAILVLGDSLSAAHGIPQEAGWVSLLKSRLAQEKFPGQVINSSISGETTRGGRTRITPLLVQYHPSIVIVELGGNDGLRGLSIEQTRDNLDAIIRACKKARSQVLLLGMRLPPNYGPAYTQRFHAIYGELGRQYRVRVIPFFLDAVAGRRENFQADGIHPTAAVQPLLLETVWKELKPMLRR